ncbi:MAG: ankyrin repeat domain-containing protein [Phycisphaeraceae bacterium]
MIVTKQTITYFYFLLVVTFVLGCSGKARQVNLVDLYESDGVQSVKGYVLENPESINDRNESGDSVLMLATFDGKAGLVDFLIAHGANLQLENEVGHSAITLACLRRNHGVVKSLLEAGANPNAREGTPLCLAVESRDALLCHTLLESGADPDLKAVTIVGRIGQTPRTIAEEIGDDKVLKVFREYSDGDE